LLKESGRARIKEKRLTKGVKPKSERRRSILNNKAGRTVREEELI